jgi:hypothetical protein
MTVILCWSASSVNRFSVTLTVAAAVMKMPAPFMSMTPAFPAAAAPFPARAAPLPKATAPFPARNKKEQKSQACN